PVALRWRAARRRTIHGTIAGFSPGPCRAGALAHRLGIASPRRQCFALRRGRPAPTIPYSIEIFRRVHPPPLPSRGFTRELAEAGQAAYSAPFKCRRQLPAQARWPECHVALLAAVGDEPDPEP